MAYGKLLKIVVASVGVLVVASVAGCLLLGPTAQRVTLKNGETYMVETFRGLPTGFQNDQIKVRDLGVTAGAITLTNLESPPYVWHLAAELKARGSYTVTVSSLLDKKASATLNASGPGLLNLRFFPKSDYSIIWESFDKPGTNYFPFHFVFEEKETKNRFEFTQWAKFDDRDREETRKQFEWIKQQLRR